MRKSTLATFALLFVTAIWGSTFFIIKDAVGRIDPVDFLAVRFAIGAAIPAVVFWRGLRNLDARQWRIGLALGLVYGLAQVVQTIGLRTTPASASGFITGTYVVITPLIMWLAFRARLNIRSWLAVGLALVGLAALSLDGLNGIGTGEALTLAGAALYAVHIVLLDRWSRVADAMSLTVAQLIGIALTTAVLSIPGGLHVPTDPVVWGAIGYTAIAAGIVTMLLQTWAQRHITPTRVVLLMTFEPVFAALFAVLFGGEDVTARLLGGGSLILLATLIGAKGGQADNPGAPDRADGVTDSTPVNDPGPHAA